MAKGRHGMFEGQGPIEGTFNFCRGTLEGILSLKKKRKCNNSIHNAIAIQFTILDSWYNILQIIAH